jgi:hypothetical protein
MRSPPPCAPPPNQKPIPSTMRAELSGCRSATALGITVRASAPVFELCRALVAAGHDPDRPLHARSSSARSAGAPATPSRTMRSEPRSSAAGGTGRSGAASPIRPTRQALVMGHPNREAML